MIVNSSDFSSTFLFLQILKTFFHFQELYSSQNRFHNRKFKYTCILLPWLLEWICRYSRAAIKKKDSDKTNSKDVKLSWLDAGATMLTLALSKHTKTQLCQLLEEDLTNVTNVGDGNMIDIVKIENSL